jgi:hypothetical protein
MVGVTVKKVYCGTILVNNAKELGLRSRNACALTDAPVTLCVAGNLEFKNFTVYFYKPVIQKL